MKTRSKHLVNKYDWGILQQMKEAEDKIVSLALYHPETAKMAAPYLDFILVGDSVAMTVHGYSTTQKATMEMMILHGQWVVSGAEDRAPVVVDMPACSYKTDVAALLNARALVRETGASAVKLEGGKEKAEAIRCIVIEGIPVMAHIGLMPSHFGEEGGYKTVGYSQKEADALIADALAVEEAGAFAVVLEGVAEPVAKYLTEILTIPTIGIGASPDCSGQILVINDVLGLKTSALSKPPKFAKCFKEEGMSDKQAVAAYAKAVTGGAFPDRKLHCFALKANAAPINFYARAAAAPQP